MILTAITVSDSQALTTLLRRFQHLDWSRPLKSFSGYFVRSLGQQIETAGDIQRGGAGRGVFWRGMAPQYTRKDGTIVPAWGGVAKVKDREGKRYGGTTVKGRLSRGKRTQANDKLYGKALKSPGRLLKRRVDGATLTIGLSRAPGMEYAEAKRQFLFFQDPTDRRALERIVNGFVRREAAGGKR